MAFVTLSQMHGSINVTHGKICLCLKILWIVSYKTRDELSMVLAELEMADDPSTILWIGVNRFDSVATNFPVYGKHIKSGKCRLFFRTRDHKGHNNAHDLKYNTQNIVDWSGW